MGVSYGILADLQYLNGQGYSSVSLFQKYCFGFGVELQGVESKTCSRKIALNF
jgi:hypothetical protein